MIPYTYIDLKQIYWHGSIIKTIKQTIDVAKTCIESKYFYLDSIPCEFVAKVYDLNRNDFDYLTLTMFSKYKLNDILERKEIKYEFLNYLIYDKIETDLKQIDNNAIPYLFLALVLLNSNIIIRTSLPFELRIWSNKPGNNIEIGLEDIKNINRKEEDVSLIGLDGRIKNLLQTLKDTINERVNQGIEMCIHKWGNEVLDREEESYITVEDYDEEEMSCGSHEEYNGTKRFYQITCLNCGMRKEKIEGLTDYKYLYEDIKRVKDKLMKEMGLKNEYKIFVGE